MSYVQRVADNEDFDGNNTFVISITPSAGNLLAIAVAWESSGGISVSTVVDTQGNTWQLGKSQVDGAINSVVGYYAENVVGAATTITVTFSSAPSRQRGIVNEFSGRAASGALDVSAGQGQAAPGTGTDAVSSGAASVTTTGSDIFGFSCESNTQPTYAAGTNYTLGASEAIGFADEHRDNVTAGSHAATFTTAGGSGSPTTIMMAFKPTGGKQMRLGRPC